MYNVKYNTRLYKDAKDGRRIATPYRVKRKVFEDIK